MVTIAHKIPSPTPFYVNQTKNLCYAFTWPGLFNNFIPKKTIDIFIHSRQVYF